MDFICMNATELGLYAVYTMIKISKISACIFVCYQLFILQKVLKLFKTSPPEVQLTLCRPPPGKYALWHTHTYTFLHAPTSPTCLPVYQGFFLQLISSLAHEWPHRLASPASSEATVCFRTKQGVATETVGRTADKAVLISWQEH